MGSSLLSHTSYRIWRPEWGSHLTHSVLYCSAFPFLFPTGSQEKGVWIHPSPLAIESPRFSPTSESWIENVLGSFLTLGIVLELIEPRFSPNYASCVPQKIQTDPTLLHIWGRSRSHSPLLVSLGVEVGPGLIDSCFMTAWGVSRAHWLLFYDGLRSVQGSLAPVLWRLEECPGLIDSCFMTAWGVSRALPIPSQYCDAGSFSPRPAGNTPKINKKLIFHPLYDLPVFTSVSDPDPDWTRIQVGLWIRIRIPTRDPNLGRQKDPQKKN